MESYFAQSNPSCMTDLSLKNNKTWKHIGRHMKSMENKEMEVWFDDFLLCVTSLKSVMEETILLTSLVNKKGSLGQWEVIVLETR